MIRDAYIPLPYSNNLQFERLVFSLVKNEHHALPGTSHSHCYQLLIACSLRRAGSHILDESLYLPTSAQD